MLLFALSILALVAGPLVYRAAARAGDSPSVLDGFVMVAISGLVLVHIIPHAVESSGALALIAAGLGFFGPGLVEGALRNAADRVHTITLQLALVGLLLHGFFDGVGLALPGDGHGSNLLPIAVVLHRLPVSLTIWSLLLPRTGARITGLVIIGLIAATTGGFAAADLYARELESSWLGIVQALIAGSLLHVVIHRPPQVARRSSARRARMMAGLGGLTGIASVAFLASEHIAAYGDTGGQFARGFVMLASESAPALLLAFTLAGLVQVLLPHISKSWVRTGRPLGESLRGVAFGLPIPICSCGVVPLYQSLINQAVPATASMAFLVATPELGIDAVLISLPLLGAELTTVRVLSAAAVAVVAGFLIGRIADRRPVAVPREADDRPAPAAPANLAGRLRAGLRFGFVEIVDHTGPWLVLGLAIAALAGPLLEGEWLTSLPFGADVVVFALLGMPSYVCASGATPLVAVLVAKGASPGAAIAFLLAGPATNITTFGVLAKLHGRQVAAAFAGLIAGMSIAIGLLVNLLLAPDGNFAVPELDPEASSQFKMACLYALGAILALSILRQGPRGFVGQLLWPYDEGGEHDHGDSCCGD